MTQFVIEHEGVALFGPAPWSPQFRAETGIANKDAPAVPHALATGTLREVYRPEPSPAADLYQTVSYAAGTVDEEGRWYLAPSVSDMSLADAKARAKEAATAKFRAVRAGGTTINGALISTDQNALVELSEVVEVLDGTSDTLDVVTRSGSSLSLDYDTAVALRGAVRAHYKAAVEREAALYAAIDGAGSLTALRDIDIDSGWPT